ncbi:amine sulfotransferase-like [Sardina pilchardus]|uniref:amine sulfotransferase-like n=1 Tax=Sardina pilchardus TaxID=27697 RepID=UPI002E0E5843
MAQKEYTLLGESLLSYKGAAFALQHFENGIPETLEYLDSLKNFHVRDGDVFIMTFPKSGTIWMQYIVSILYENDHPDLLEKPTHVQYVCPGWSTSGRLITWTQGSLPGCCAHICQSTWLLWDYRATEPNYVTRNPKDVLVSYFHFSQVFKTLETADNLDEVLEHFLSGKILGGNWFDHVEGWLNNKDKYDILFVSYEEMKLDLRSVVMKISKFVGKILSDVDVDKVMDRVTFKNMKNDPIANYHSSVKGNLFDSSKGNFMRKGAVGDWKNFLTVAQSERFDQVYRERMKRLPLKVIWDLKELHE